MAIGDHIRDLRWDAHLKQVELAHRAGIAQNTLSQIELGNTVPSVRTLEKIARGLGVEVSELLREPVPLVEPPVGVDELSELLARVGSRTQNLCDPQLVSDLQSASDAAVSRAVRQTRQELALLIPELQRLGDELEPGDDGYMAYNKALSWVSGQVLAFSLFLRARDDVQVEEEAMIAASRELFELALAG